MQEVTLYFLQSLQLVVAAVVLTPLLEPSQLEGLVVVRQMEMSLEAAEYLAKDRRVAHLRVMSQVVAGALLLLAAMLLLYQAVAMAERVHHLPFLGLQ
tara:strand:- start:232 stop:525 length:294 start_codon:yes stop_codon:yes gene_type:complete